jgi:hypothetical protein
MHAGQRLSDPRYFSRLHILKAMQDVFCLCPMNSLLPCYLDLCKGILYSSITMKHGSRVVTSADGREFGSPVPPEETGFSLQSLFTWGVHNSRKVTIIKTSDFTTVIYDHITQRAFKATPAGSLGPGCPTGTSLLAQVIMDKVANTKLQARALGFDLPCPPPGGDEEAYNEEWIPNILVFDILSFGYNNVFMDHPRERYALLQHIAADASHMIVSPYMRVRILTCFPSETAKMHV